MDEIPFCNLGCNLVQVLFEFNFCVLGLLINLLVRAFVSGSIPAQQQDEQFFMFGEIHKTQRWEHNDNAYFLRTTNVHGDMNSENQLPCVGKNFK